MNGSAGDGVLLQGAAGNGAVACARLVHPAPAGGVEGKHCRTMANTIAYSRPSCGGHTSIHEAGGRHVLIFGESAHVLALRHPGSVARGVHRSRLEPPRSRRGVSDSPSSC